MRGRVMALWSVAFLGSTPIGGPIAGMVTERFGARSGLLLGALACLVAAGFGMLVLRRHGEEPVPDEASTPGTASTLNTASSRDEASSLIEGLSCGGASIAESEPVAGAPAGDEPASTVVVVDPAASQRVESVTAGH